MVINTFSLPNAQAYQNIGKNPGNGGQKRADNLLKYEICIQNNNRAMVKGEFDPTSD